MSTLLFFPFPNNPSAYALQVSPSGIPRHRQLAGRQSAMRGIPIDKTCSMRYSSGKGRLSSRTSNQQLAGTPSSLASFLSVSDCACGSSDS